MRLFGKSRAPRPAPALRVRPRLEVLETRLAPTVSGNAWPHPEKITERLDHWAKVAPERTFIAQRGSDGRWRQLTYGEARDRARDIGQALSAGQSDGRFGLAHGSAHDVQLRSRLRGVLDQSFDRRHVGHDAGKQQNGPR